VAKEWPSVSQVLAQGIVDKRRLSRMHGPRVLKLHDHCWTCLAHSNNLFDQTQTYAHQPAFL